MVIGRHRDDLDEMNAVERKMVAAQYPEEHWWPEWVSG